MEKAGLLICLVVAISWSSNSHLAAQTELDALAERAEMRHTNVPRKVLAFYYPWYGNPNAKGGSGKWSHWTDVDESTGRIGSSTHYPSLGPYDSHDPKLIAQHCAWAKQAGVDGFIASWWGKDSFTDRAMERILNGCKDAGIEVTIYYETVPCGGGYARMPYPASATGNAQAAAKDILYLLKRYGGHPAWLCINGKPVVFVYGRAIGQIGLAGWLSVVSQVNGEHPSKAVFVGDQISRPAAGIFDGIHTYNTAGALRGKALPEAKQWATTTYPSWVETADSFGRISAVTIIPGYDDTKIRKPGLRVERMDGALYQRQWEQAIAADPHWILITSWNEWHEGSEIEPSVEYGTQYLGLTSEFASRFKSKARLARPLNQSEQDRTREQQRAKQLEKLRGIKIGVLPDPGLPAIWPLLRLPDRPKLVSWEKVAGFQSAAVQQHPVLIYAAGERYRQTVTRPGDVDEGLLRYLRAGGFLVVLPAGPMPFHYDEQGKTANNSRKFGLPLSVSGKDGGWEQPPKDVNLRFVQAGNQLPHVPASFPFPQQGDPRWRPFVRSQLSEDDLFLPLVALRDDKGKHYGDAVAYVEHKASEPVNGKVLYVWFGLLSSPHADALLHDLFSFVADRIVKK